MDNLKLDVDSDSDIEIITESYFSIDTIGSVNAKNIKLKKIISKYKTINETLQQNLEINKNTTMEMNKIITELTEKLNEQIETNNILNNKLSQVESTNQILTHENIVLSKNAHELDEQIEKLMCEKKYLEIQVNRLKQLKQFRTYQQKNNVGLIKVMGFLVVISCSGYFYMSTTNNN